MVSWGGVEWYGMRMVIWRRVGMVWYLGEGGELYGRLERICDSKLEKGGMVWYDKVDGMFKYLIISWFKQTSELTNIDLFLAAQLHDNFEEYLQNVLLRKKRSLGYDFSEGNRLDK